MPSETRVALFVDTQSAYGRNVIRGVNRYARTRGPWRFSGDPQRAVAPIADIGRWTGDGVIAQVSRLDIEAELRPLRVPVANVSQHRPDVPFPSVQTDGDLIGALGAEHLLERGFRHFGFCGFSDHAYSRSRRRGFTERLARQGLPCATFDGEAPQEPPSEWPRRTAELCAWLRELPQPIGVMCCNDVRAWHVAQACHDVGIRIPDDLALLGADDDELVCELCSPPLSSVDVGAFHVGYEAALLLDRLMQGEPPPGSPIMVPPVRVVTRRSTDTLALPDAMVARALQFIREHACDPVGAAEVAATLPVSRRVLERRFRAHLERSILEEIVETRLRRAKELLLDSMLPIAEVAWRSGFGYVQQFNAVFRRAMDCSPLDYRRRFLTSQSSGVVPGPQGPRYPRRR